MYIADIMKYWDQESLPEIKEITIYYTNVINGIKVVYRKCGKFKVKQPAGAKTKKKTLKMRRGEWIEKELGYVEDYVCSLELRTNLGQTLKAGEERGTLKEPKYLYDKLYMVGFNFFWGKEGLKCFFPRCINLGKVKPKELIPAP